MFGLEKAGPTSKERVGQWKMQLKSIGRSVCATGARQDARIEERFLARLGMTFSFYMGKKGRVRARGLALAGLKSGHYTGEVAWKRCYSAARFSGQWKMESRTRSIVRSAHCFALAEP